MGTVKSKNKEDIDAILSALLKTRIVHTILRMFCICKQDLGLVV